jgi:hypothetical protein
MIERLIFDDRRPQLQYKDKDPSIALWMLSILYMIFYRLLARATVGNCAWAWRGGSSNSINLDYFNLILCTVVNIGPIQHRN